jgi:hypothetical protein
MSANPLVAARKLLSDDQLVAFFRAAGREAHPPIAVKLINEHLDRGENLNYIFMMYGGPRSASRPVVMHLKVSELKAPTYMVRFGLAGHRSDDGGEWRVTYTEQGALYKVQGTSIWSE